MRPSRLMLQLALTLTLAACGSEQDPAQTASSRESYYKHGTPPGSAPYPYYLTSYGAPGDASFGTPACGGKKVDGTWYYSTGAYTFGCNSKLKLEANGKCVVVEVVDNGPAAWVEAKAAASCGGLGYIIDASPLASKALFGSSSAGWSDCFSIMVTPVPSSTPTGPTSCGSTNPNPTPTPTCGNGKLDAGEKCDSAIPDGQWGSCPTDCDDGNSCTDDFIAGANCQAACGHTYTCTQPTTPVCGNGKLETGEKCDSGIPSGQPGACPTAARGWLSSPPASSSPGSCAAGSASRRCRSARPSRKRPRPAWRPATPATASLAPAASVHPRAPA